MNVESNSSAGRMTLGSLAITFPLLAGAMIDLPRLWRVGELTWLGILAVAQMVIASAIVAANRRYRARLLVRYWSFGGLLAWSALGFVWWAPSADALPNVLSYWLLATIGVAAAISGMRDVRQTDRSISLAVFVVDVVGLSIAAASFGFHGFDVHSWPVHPRAFALAALAPLSWHLAQWATGRWWALIPAIAWVAAIFVSLSRMATAAAIIAMTLTVLLNLQSREQARRVPIAALGVVLVALLFAVGTIAPFRDRLMKPEDRTPLWDRVSASALEAPVIGKGPGASQTRAVLRYWWQRPPESTPLTSRWYQFRDYWTPQPHNDYLRVWHDLGAPGLAFFVVGLGGWLGVLIRSVPRARESGDASTQRLNLAGLLMIVTLLLAMVTDNPLVYPFVIGPAAVLIGAGVGAGSREPKYEHGLG